MRVIAGTCRGRTLAVPAGMTTRPTSDRAKEALFSILSSRIDFLDARVLDICAGTGSLGIEALSRGAASCCFIEYGLSVKKILDKNLQVTCFQDRSEIVQMDAVKAIRALSRRNLSFDLVFFDPPYASELYSQIPDSLDASGLLAPAATLVVECSSRSTQPESYGRLKKIDRRIYGETAFELFILEEK